MKALPVPALPSYEEVKSQRRNASESDRMDVTVEQTSSNDTINCKSGMQVVPKADFPLSAGQQLLLLLLINLITAIVDYYVFYVALTENDSSEPDRYELLISDQGNVIQKPVLTSHNPIVLLIILLLIWTVFVLVLNMMAVIASFQGRTLGDVFRPRR